MTDEQLIVEFQKHTDEWRDTGRQPASADAAVAGLIGIIGANRPGKSRAIAALAQVDWTLALSFLGALTPPGMVFVPAGLFTMGSAESDDEQPVHRVWVDSYYLDRTPVTNKQFGFFWEDVPYADSDDAWVGFEAGRKVIFESGQRRAPFHWFDEDWNAPSKPVVGVSWYEAAVYARWAGKRLPTEAEWEKGARGTDARRYPWGNTWDASRCNSNLASEPVKATTPVGRYSPAGDSPFGAQDMAGNVWQWTNSLYCPYPYSVAGGREDPNAQGRRVLRGGGFGSNFEDHYRSAHRYPQPPDYIYVSVGFRCAATVPPPARV